ncbi:MAG: hypothetical protein JXX29_00870 [Deltaproteobacteria bacterium]|nr:hypothetical protein [Deltaproteobacteria bacterium]MBN2670190.1 hypothetical protein [Deltaproteobacteria bacterium]
MRWVNRYMWLFPFVVHAAYMTATIRFFPFHVGTDESLTNRWEFFAAEWISIVLFSNAALFFVLHKMPKFSDKTLSVPNKAYWLQSTETRAALIDKLQGLVETTLVLINIFLLGIYQLIYQTNVMVAAVKLPITVLLSAFVVLPVALTLANIISVRISLAKAKTK